MYGSRSFHNPTAPASIDLAPPELAPALPAAAAGQDPIVVPAASPNAQPLSDDPTDLGNLSSVTTFADTGLRLGFAGGVTVESIDASMVETYWTHMQTCLNVVAIAPLVIVTDEAIEPLSNSDDVIHYIDGSITATATRYTTGATIQISVHDLDGTLGRIGFNLRSIMGRYLWTSSNLPERDYPHSCASDD